MNTLYTIMLSVCLVTLSGSCRLDAAQAAAKANAADQKPAKPKPDPRLKGIPIQHHEFLKPLFTKEPRMMDPWLRARALYDEAMHAATVFGIRERKRARSKAPTLFAKAKKEEEAFRRAYERFRTPIEERESDLKDRAMKLSEQEGALNDPLISKRLDELYDEAYIYAEQLNALSDLAGVFYRLNKSPSDMELLGIGSHDSVASKVAEENPNLVEARMVIRDCEADIAALEKQKAEAEKDPAKQWKSSDDAQIARAQAMLERAVETLEREAERAKKPLLREAETIKKRMEAMQDKIEKTEKRGGRTTTLYQRLSTYDGDLQNCLKAAALIDKLATWKKPDKKKPAAKKGGH